MSFSDVHRPLPSDAQSGSNENPVNVSTEADKVRRTLFDYLNPLATPGGRTLTMTGVLSSLLLVAMADNRESQKQAREDRQSESKRSEEREAKLLSAHKDVADLAHADSKQRAERLEKILSDHLAQHQKTNEFQAKMYESIRSTERVLTGVETPWWVFGWPAGKPKVQAPDPREKKDMKN